MPGDTTLRPYYNHDTFNAGYSVIYKPGVGLIDTSTNKEIVSTFGGSFSQQAGNGTASSFGKVGINAIGSTRPDQFVSADKNYAYDLEFLEYLDLGNLQETFKDLVWNFVKNYCKALFSQPLDIVRLILQVGYFNFSENSTAALSSSLKSSLSVAPDDDLDEDEIDFFQSNTTETPVRPSAPSSAVREKPNFKVQPVSQHTFDVLSAVMANDGAVGALRGINAAFIYSTLSHTIKAWITGFASPFLNIPDPFFLDLTHSTEPAKSLWLSVIACVITGLVLMPLDLIKVRLMLTPISKRRLFESVTPSSSNSDVSDNSPPSINLRSIRESLRHYPVKLILRPPIGITCLTIVHQFATTVFRKSAPYFLFIRYNIDSYLSPTLFTIANLMLSITELFIKLPVENLLRKEQVRFLLKHKSREEDEYRVVTIDNPEENLVVEYNGWGKFSHVARDASFLSKIHSLRLFSGWRVGVLNVIGYWGYNIFKSSPVMAEERL